MQLTGGPDPGEVYLRVKVDNIADVVMAVIRQGGLKQQSIAEALEMGRDVFSKKFGNPGDCFYTALEQLETIMAVTGQIAPVEFWALKHGFRLVPVERREPKTVDDETGGPTIDGMKFGGLRKP